MKHVSICRRDLLCGRPHFWLKSSIFVLALVILGTAPSDAASQGQASKGLAAPLAYAFEDYSKTHMINEVNGDMGLTLPLFTLPTAGNLEYPVVLNYKSGIQLEQRASEVGLGWSLNHSSFHRSINGVPDDISAGTDDADNYFYYEKSPAVYPMSQFLNQKRALNAAKKKANRSMIVGAVVSLAVSAATFGAGTALAPSLMGTATLGETMTMAAISSGVSTTAQYAQMAGEQPKTAAEMHASQAMIKAMIDSKSTSSDTTKVHGRIYYEPSFGSENHLNLDQYSSDKYFVSSPTYVGEIIMGNRGGDTDEQVLWPATYQSNTVHVDYSDNDLADFDSDYEDNGIPNLGNPLVTLSENNMVALVDTDAYGTYEGFVLVDVNGNRYFFNDPIESAVPSDLSGFVPTELEGDDALPNVAYASYSWRDHFPGGISELPEDLHGGSGKRYGAAEAVLSAYDISWGLSRIQNGNRALFGKGPEINFEYEDLQWNDSSDDVFTTSDTGYTITGSGYFGMGNLSSWAPTGHRLISRGFKTHQLLKRIYSTTHEIVFNYSYDRNDGKEAFAFSLTALDGFPKLNDVVFYAIQSGNKKTLARYVFDYDYSLMYGAPDNVHVQTIQDGKTCSVSESEQYTECGRLTLKRLTYEVCQAWQSNGECNENGWAAMSPIEFEYANNDLPNLDSVCREWDMSTFPPEPITVEVSDALVSCVFDGKAVNDTVVETQNPRYIRDAQDGWGYVYLSTHCTSSDCYQAHLHNPNHYPTGYVPEAWSLTKVMWPSGGNTEFSYEPDTFRYVNDLNLEGNYYGGGARVKWHKNHDGLSTSNDIYTLYRYVDCEASDYDCTISSGVTQGVPKRRLYKNDYQKLSELQESSPKASSLIQSNYYGLQYSRVMKMLSPSASLSADWGLTQTDFTTTKDSNFTGKGNWTPQKMLPFYNWKESGSNGNTPHPDKGWVAFARVEFEPKKENDSYNQLHFKEYDDDSGNYNKYVVAADRPGYLFWMHFNAGRDSCICGSRCAMKARAQHPFNASSSDLPPPFIGGSCPGEEEGIYCGEIQFEDRGVGGWDWENGGSGIDCDEPGEMLIFCPSDEQGLISDPSNSADDYNPLEAWEGDLDWRGAVENRFVYGLADDGRWRTWVFDWHDVCYEIFGGNTDIGTDEMIYFKPYAPSCVDKLDGDGTLNDDGNQVCDLAEHADTLHMGKQQRAYTLGLKKRVAHYSSSDLQTPVKEETFAYEFNPYESLEGEGLYIGNSRLVEEVQSLDGRTTTTTYSEFDEDTGTPRITSVHSGTRTITTETLPAHEAYSIFGKTGLNMLSISGTSTVWDSETAGANISEENYSSRTISEYSNEWCGADHPYFNTCGYSAGGNGDVDSAWLLKEVTVTDGIESHSTKNIIAYDQRLNPLVEEDGNGNRIIYRYGDNEDLCGEENAAGLDNVYIRGSDFDGSQVTCVEVEVDIGTEAAPYFVKHRTSYEYDGFYRVSATTNPQGLVTEYSYDDLNRLSEINIKTRHNDSNWDVRYDYGFLDSQTGVPNFLQTQTRMSNSQTRSEITYSDGMGRNLQKRYIVEDDEALITNYSYDGRGLLAQTSKPKISAGGLDYTNTGFSSDPNESSFTTYYPDPLVRVHEQQPLGADSAGGETLTTRYEYSSENGHAATTAIDANGNSTKTITTAFGHPVTKEDGAGNTTSYETDALGNIVTLIDALGRVALETTYDALGRPTQSIRYPDSATPEETVFAYDASGNLISRTNAHGTTTYTYDELNRLLKTDYPGDTADVLNYYDYPGPENTGSCLGRTLDPYGCTIGDINNDGSSDVLDVVSTVGYIVGNGTTFNEDQQCSADFNMDGFNDVLDIVAMVSGIVGNNDLYMNQDPNYEWLTPSVGLLCRTQMCVADDCEPGNGAPFVAYNYDKRGRVTGTQTQEGFTFYEQNDGGDVIKTKHSPLESRKRVFYTYDLAGRLSSMTIGTDNEITFEYTNNNNNTEFAGRLKRINFPNGLFTKIDTSPRGLTSVINIEPSVSWAEIYEYDRVGNLSEVTDGAANAASFDYDSKDQLETLTNNGYYQGLDASEIEYQYNAIGNRTQRTATGGQWSGCYREHVLGDVYNYIDQSDRLTSTDTEGCDYGYDGSGNLIAMTGCSATSAGDGLNDWYMEYDAENRLTGIDVTNDCTGDFSETYTYDPLGRRTKKIHGESQTSYLFGSNMQPLTVTQGEEKTHYYYAGDRLVAQEQNGEMLFVHQDRMMSNRVLTDADGEIRSESITMPFGQELLNDGLRFSFATGKELDDTGLYFFEARYYDPALGRFTSVDPLWMEDNTWASYVYGHNNPLRFLDPNGMKAEVSYDEFIDYLKISEGFVKNDQGAHVPYKDSKGYWTIGYGKLISSQKNVPLPEEWQGVAWSESKALSVLHAEADKAMADAQKYVALRGYDWDSLTSRQQYGIGDFMYNVGYTKMTKKQQFWNSMPNYLEEGHSLPVGHVASQPSTCRCNLRRAGVGVRNDRWKSLFGK